MSLKKFCRCGKIIDQTQKYCSECEQKHLINTREYYKGYSSRRTDIREQRFYTSDIWRITRENIKIRDKGICRLCNSKDKCGFIDHIHHIIELKDDWSLRTTQSNLIGLCERCHYYVHMQYKKGLNEKREMQKELFEIINGEGHI